MSESNIGFYAWWIFFGLGFSFLLCLAIASTYNKTDKQSPEEIGHRIETLFNKQEERHRKDEDAMALQYGEIFLGLLDHLETETLVFDRKKLADGDLITISPDPDSDEIEIRIDKRDGAWR